MSILKKWKAMTFEEKVNMIIGGICDLGGMLIMGSLAGKFCSDSDPFWKRAAVKTTLSGAGIYLGKISAGEFTDMMDAVRDSLKKKEDSDA